MPRSKPPFCWCHDEAIPAALLQEAEDAAEAPAAPKPQEGEERTCTWDELLYAMTHGEMGTKPRDDAEE